MTPPPGSRSVRTIWVLTFGGAIVWMAMIFLAPWLAARGAAGAARVLYAVFAPVCHQIAGRCFVLNGHPLAVCGRCLGIYAGVLAGLVLYPFIRGFSRPALPGARALVLVTLPLALDGLAGILGIWNSSIGLRFATGVLWGGILPFYFVAGLADLVRIRRERLAAREACKRPPGDIE
jgi:uncharacterized membrane protein